MTVCAYVRVSTARQASEGESLDVQQRQISGYALMHGFAVDEATIEEGVSGSIPVAERPAGAALFAKLKAAMSSLPRSSTGFSVRRSTRCSRRRR